MAQTTTRWIILRFSQSGNISVYARGRDYHEVIKGKLKQLAGQIASQLKTEVKVFVDRPLNGKAACATGRIRLAGKAYKSC